MPNHPPIHGFTPYTPSRTASVRLAREPLFLEPPPKARKHRKPPAESCAAQPSRKRKKQPVLPPHLANLPPALAAQLLQALRNKGLV